MKIKDLINELSSFNPEAEVDILFNNQPYPLEIYGWDCGGDNNYSSTESKQKAISVSLSWIGFNDGETAISNNGRMSIKNA
jgi:hypothetical protein